MKLTHADLNNPADDAEGDTPSIGEHYAQPHFTNAAFEAERDPTRRPMFIPEQWSWLAPLLDAIGSPVFPDSERKTALWGTEWGQDGKEGNAPEHAAYVAYVKAFTSQRMPWLIPLLDGARAIVMVSPGSYFFGVDNYIGHSFDIPELQPYTHLVPWATEDERRKGY
ncbi:MAG: hypothetical protein H0X13_16335 [Ramlibacter sp.]|nr:hypothetical protein [Ramlibacter sp.]